MVMVRLMVMVPLLSSFTQSWLVCSSSLVIVLLLVGVLLISPLLGGLLFAVMVLVYPLL